jgi:hypothetical protein
MADYRAYFVGNDGHFVDVQAIVSESDSAAIEQAKGFLGDRPIEMWCGERLVIRLNGKPDSPA